MKATAIPTMCYGLASAMALVFYAGFSRLYGDQLLGTAILITSVVSLLTIAVVPQAWAYIIAATSQGDLSRRFSTGVVAEAAGGLIGLVFVVAFTFLPVASAREYSVETILIYLGLWIASATCARGYYRAQERWSWFASWVLLPNALRVVLLSLAWLDTHSELGLNSLLADRRFLFFFYFLLPEIGRFLITNAPLILQQFHLVTTDDFALGLGSIWHNWLFEVGSALTEVADKVVVGTALGPQLLVPYFFGRKVGAIAAMFVDPYYLEQYRQLAGAKTASRADGVSQKGIYSTGLLLAASIYVLLVTGITVAMLFTPLPALVPQAVQQNKLIFLVILLIECGIAANRWTRYSSHVSGKSTELLVFRASLCLVFAIEIAWFGSAWNGVGVCVAFVGLWFLETIYVTFLVHGPGSPETSYR